MPRLCMPGRGFAGFAERLLSSAWKPKPRKTLGGLIVEGCTRFGITADSLRSRSRQEHLTRARAWIVKLHFNYP